MAIITNNTKHAIDLIVPFSVVGYVLYDSYVKKGSKDMKTILIMSAVVGIITYIVTTQITRLIDDKD